MPLTKVWLNDRLLPLSEARISPMDRGFLFGDGVYEAMPVHAGRAYRFDQHIARLDRSLRELGMTPTLDRAAWLAVCGALVHGNDAGQLELFLYLQVTRGVEAERNHVPTAGTPPTIFAFAMPESPQPATMPTLGVAAITTQDLRWQRCDIKAISLLGNVLARWEAARADTREALLLREGYLMEASTSSAHIVRDGVLITPPPAKVILPGTTRAVLIELAERAGIPFQHRPISEAELRQADEVLIASSGGGVRPVTTLDAKPVGNGRPGPVFASLYRWMNDTRQEFSVELPR